MPETSAVDLADVKAHLNFTSVDAGEDDEVLQSFIDAAEATIASVVGPLSPTNVVATVQPGRGDVSLAVLPVLALVSITGTGGTSVDLDAVTLDTDTGLLAGRGMLARGRSYTVTYTAGRAELPADLEMAVKELVRHLWLAAQRGQGRPGTNPEPTPGYLIPNMVASLHEPHSTGPAFA